MAVLPVQFTGPTFPDGYCPPTLQQFANDFAAGIQASSPLTLDNVIISQSAPSDHTKLWFKLDGSLNPFVTAAGVPLFKWSPTETKWVLLHPMQPGQHRWEEFANLAEIDTYDGGSAGPVSATAGPFWELDTAYDGRSPMSPGVIVGSNPSKTLGYKENFGEGAHLQSVEEVGPHTHPITPDTLKGGGGTTSTDIDMGNTGTPTATLVISPNEYTTTQQAMPIIHPVRSMSCIKRTIRLYYEG